ncbi:Ig-like domain-containing protein [Blastococcus sp. BMG 814]|uniref:Ig-like domain-containing protein n=1 Tax=Blastococcus carthaginiensis TaxID=3050034 RepID=A0ABT9I993_9ACTN|nr:Ig-like domain-containing protein [Blastococcus carthaginiensis]MDP5182133.1 Ig-like domain-containing protein [Blastococcus carthaginiensis]
MRRTATMIATGALVLLAGCNGSDAEEAGGPTAAAEPATIELAVADGAVDVSPAVPLEISVTGGELDGVTVTDAGGAPVAGAVEDDADDDGTALWAPETPLAYGTGYTVTATASGDAAEPTTATSSFTTVDPVSVVTPGIGPLDGQTVGVGIPIRVYFSEPVVDKAAVERNLVVTSSTPTDGVWSWFSDTEVHFRPSTYWPADTDVTLDANLYGVDFGDGVWGEKDRSISFSIGERHVSVADAAAHTMRVYDGDELVQTFPMSAGGPEFPSRNGPHVVTELNRNRVMDSSTYGTPVDSPDGYRTPVEYAVRLNDNGEFVHAAPWSVAQQGSENVSHGCINLSTERAAWFFDFSQPGDVVEIENSIGPTLSAADGAIYDWAIPWEKWVAGSALA